MSFSSEVKKELLNVDELKDCCKKAFLLGLLQSSCEYVMSTNNKRLIVRSTLLNTLKVVSSLLKEFYNIESKFSYHDEESLKNRRVYHLVINDEVDKLVDIFSLSFFKPLTKDNELIKSSCCKSAFVRGLFVGKGSINDPRKNCYHFEISVKNDNLANICKSFFKTKGIECKQIIRRDNQILYIKKSEIISSALAFIGADSGVFYFEDQRILRDVSNMANRMTNCDISNELKCAKICQEQLDAIEYIRDNNYFDLMPQRLQTTAILREEYPDSSYDELSFYSENIFGKKLSKSGVTHCLKALMNYYNDLKSKLESNNEETL